MNKYDLITQINTQGAEIYAPSVKVQATLKGIYPLDDDVVCLSIWHSHARTVLKFIAAKRNRGQQHCCHRDPDQEV